MPDTYTNFHINSSYSPSFDITWSFQFKLSSSDTMSTGGFSTFLFKYPTLAGGGKYTGLKYAPYQADSGVTGAVIGVMITNDAKLVVKNGAFNNLGTITNILTGINISSNTLINQNFLTIRINLTNLGQNLIISLKNPVTDLYTNILSVNTGLKINDTYFYKIGFGVATPLNSGDPSLKISFKDIHTQGSLTAPTTKITTPPFVFPTAETFYILQSPSSEKIAIGIPDPIIGGYLMHK